MWGNGVCESGTLTYMEGSAVDPDDQELRSLCHTQ